MCRGSAVDSEAGGRLGAEVPHVARTLARAAHSVRKLSARLRGGRWAAEGACRRRQLCGAALPQRRTAPPPPAGPPPAPQPAAAAPPPPPALPPPARRPRLQRRQERPGRRRAGVRAPAPRRGVGSPPQPARLPRRGARMDLSAAAMGGELAAPTRAAAQAQAQAQPPAPARARPGSGSGSGSGSGWLLASSRPSSSAVTGPPGPAFWRGDEGPTVGSSEAESRRAELLRACRRTAPSAARGASAAGATALRCASAMRALLGRPRRGRHSWGAAIVAVRVATVTRALRGEGGRDLVGGLAEVVAWVGARSAAGVPAAHVPQQLRRSTPGSAAAR